MLRRQLHSVFQLMTESVKRLCRWWMMVFTQWPKCDVTYTIMCEPNSFQMAKHQLRQIGVSSQLQLTSGTTSIRPGEPSCIQRWTRQISNWVLPNGGRSTGTSMTVSSSKSTQSQMVVMTSWLVAAQRWDKQLYIELCSPHDGDDDVLKI